MYILGHAGLDLKWAIPSQGFVGFPHYRGRYITYMLEEMMQKDKTFARYAPKLEKLSIDDDRVIIKDNIKNRIAEVAIQKGELYCQLCESKNCVHVGYVFSLPDVYSVLNSHGIKRPR